MSSPICLALDVPTLDEAKALATLLRGNVVSTVHVPGKEVRQKKNSVRQRLWLARVRTMVRNRIHTVLDCHPRIERPAVKDPFSNQGKAWMKRVELPNSCAFHVK